jgi:hypothetical protein
MLLKVCTYLKMQTCQEKTVIVETTDPYSTLKGFFRIYFFTF